MATVTEQAILDALKNVEDPDLKKDIVSLGFIKDLAIKGGDVSFKVELTTPACPVKDILKKQAIHYASQVEGVDNVNVEMTARVNSSFGSEAGKMLPGVKNVIPVASAKGGVGKSTVSANLALALAKTGAKVGLMDADVYGPSIPVLMGLGKGVEQSPGGKIIPVEKFGLKIISVGFFIPEGQAVIWRGPMLNKMITQFIVGVEWGELDYLIVDLPPGTGDVQLTLCQQVPLTGAVIVSTPQTMAVHITKKAIYMFQQLNCPLLGVIENMSYYLLPSGEKDYIFGDSGAQEISKEFDIPFLGGVPIATPIRVQSDAGAPIVEAFPDSVEAKAFRDIAEQLASRVSVLNISGEVNQEIKVSF